MLTPTFTSRMQKTLLNLSRGSLQKKSFSIASKGVVINPWSRIWPSPRKRKLRSLYCYLPVFFMYCKELPLFTIKQEPSKTFVTRLKGARL